MREITLRPISKGGAVIRQVYRFAWKNNRRRAELFGRACVIETVGKRMNTVCIRMLDTKETVTCSRRALRKW
jgi:hypothetical protein